MEDDALRELSKLFAQAGFENEHEQDSDLNLRSQNPVNCATSILGKRKHPEDKVDLSQSPYAKKIKITHTEQVKKNEGAVKELPRSRSAGF